MIGTASDRAVSTAVGYALTLGISTLLVTGLVVAGGSFLEQQRQETIRDEMTVVGQQLAANIGAADRLARTGEVERVSVRRTLPERVVGSSYNIEVVGGGSEDRIHLISTDPDLTVVIDVQTRTSLQSGMIGGGTVVITLDTQGTDDPSDDELVVRSE